MTRVESAPDRSTEERCHTAVTGLQPLCAPGRQSAQIHRQRHDPFSYCRATAAFSSEVGHKRW
jgi:hypothetical protein